MLGLASTTRDMKKTIFCRTTDKGTLSFYVRIGEVSSFLFATKYYKSARQLFVKGVDHHRLFDLSRSRNTAVRNTSTRVLVALRKYQKDTGIAIFRPKADCARERNPKLTPIFWEDSIPSIVSS